MEEFKSRRAKLIAHLPNNSIVLLPSAQLQIRNGDAEYPFRQNSDFYYLTGFCEPSAVMVLIKDDKANSKYILFNQVKDPEAEIWHGKRVGQQDACSVYGADESFPIDQIDSLIPDLFADRQHAYYPLTANAEFDQMVAKWLRIAKGKSNRTAKKVPDSFFDVLPLIHELRLFKSPQEINYMRKAAEISSAAHLELMRNCRPGLMEYQLEAKFNYHCLNAGARGLAYNSIVAGGSNACVLHYTTNDQVLKDNDLVLVDAGCEYNYYASDITRTFPVGGKFTPEQKQIYSIVLQAQLAGIEQVRPGSSVESAQEVMVEIIVKGLVDLGILKGDITKLIKDKAYRQFYMHSSGHWLGLDVHDAGAYKKDGEYRKLEPGMVVTIEPGIYIAEDSNVAKKWLGIGIRIEDDVLVTPQGNDVLSKGAPKHIDEIESARV